MQNQGYQFEIYKDVAGEHRVRFMYRGKRIFTTEGYASKTAARQAVRSIKLNGLLAKVVEA